MSISTDDVKIAAALLADEDELKKKKRKFWLHPINEIITSSYLPLPIVMFVTSIIKSSYFFTSKINFSSSIMNRKFTLLSKNGRHVKCTFRLVYESFRKPTKVDEIISSLPNYSAGSLKQAIQPN
jgi:hypothetical protein